MKIIATIEDLKKYKRNLSQADSLYKKNYIQKLYSQGTPLS